MKYMISRVSSENKGKQVKRKNSVEKQILKRRKKIIIAIHRNRK